MKTERRSEAATFRSAPLPVEFASVRLRGNMLGNSGSYANKKRKKPVLKQKKPTKGNEAVKSNPSKRHRERLNGELDRLTDLLPFSEEVRSRLDKLSVLRLSVGYLRVKSYFNASTTTRNSSLTLPGVKGQIGNGFDTTSFSEGDLLLQALNGFVIVVTSQGSVFYVSATVKDYLGFQESDVVHQSVFELIHTDDRALFKQQLHFALQPPASAADEDDLQRYSPEQLPPENSSFLERSFVCRFRCLLDNSSGFLALMFQGRLKYLHGQEGLRGNGVSNKPQLALFSIAMPVQPPSIVEIRAKMLLFQSKHKLDFTPTAIDTRGRVILGYSEMELCMRGSGYQFIHAADMMHCADTHLRMIKTGETGMTVFRLLRKSGNWQWVKANAKLFFKEGRPDFIISYQKALTNAEGEEHLRRRGLKPAFSFSGEAVLYNSGPSLDVSQVQFNKMFYDDDIQKDVLPGSLLDSFLKQDETAYTQAADCQLPMDTVFQDSWPLLSVPSDSWQESGITAATGAPMATKAGAKQLVMNMMDKLEILVENGELCSVLQNLDVADSELMEWEHTVTLLRLEENQQDNLSAELDGILTNNIFDYIDSVLFTGKEGNGLCAGPPSYLAAVDHRQQRPEAPSFLTASSDCTFSPLNGIYAPRQDAMNGTLSPGETVKTLPHCPPLVTQADAKPPPHQQLQLPDIFTPSIELPQITLPGAAEHDGSVTHQSSRVLVCPENKFQPPAAAGSGHYPQSSAAQPHNEAPGLGGVSPSLLPCSSFNSCGTPSGPVPFATTCLQSSPPTGGMQNGYEPMLACHSQTPESQTLPHAGLWPVGVTRSTQHGGLACGQASTPSRGAFDGHFSCSPAGGGVLALSASSGQRVTDVSLEESPQGSCYFHWGHSKPVMGTPSMAQESANVSPLTAPSSLAFNMPHFLEYGGQVPVNVSHCGLDPFNQQENYDRN